MTTTGSSAVPRAVHRRDRLRLSPQGACRPGRDRGPRGRAPLLHLAPRLDVHRISGFRGDVQIRPLRVPRHRSRVAVCRDRRRSTWRESSPTATVRGQRERFGVPDSASRLPGITKTAAPRNYSALGRAPEQISVGTPSLASRALNSESSKPCWITMARSFTC